MVVRKTVVAGNAGANSDRVMAFSPVPPGGKVISITGELHVIGTQDTSTLTFSAYGVSGNLIPVIDPDGAIDLNTMWDNMVIKPALVTQAAATVTYDWDWDSTNGEADVAIAEMDLHALSGMANPNKELMKPHVEWLSWPKGPQAGWTAGSPDTFFPTDFKRFKIRPNVVAEKIPHYAMLAFSSPFMIGNEAVTSTVMELASDWALLANVKNVMQDFWRINAGMVEATAENPYAQAAESIQDLVAPAIIQPAADVIFARTYNFLCASTFLLEFEADMVPKTLKADAG